MAIQRKHIVKLQGRDYPQWAGVLDAAHDQGLEGINVVIVQTPSAENEWTAICHATVTLRDGEGNIRTFCDIGDASPKSVPNPKLVPHLIRLASTRAKGRALRDAINVGETMYEEMGSDVAHQGTAVATDQPSPNGDFCQGCGQEMTAAQILLSTKKFGRPLCPRCQANQAPSSVPPESAGDAKAKQEASVRAKAGAVREKGEAELRKLLKQAHEMALNDEIVAGEIGNGLLVIFSDSADQSKAPHEMDMSAIATEVLAEAFRELQPIVREALKATA